MSALGAWGGAAVLSRAQAFDHWVAFGLLSLLGARTITAALRGGDARESVEPGLLAREEEKPLFLKMYSDLAAGADILAADTGVLDDGAQTAAGVGCADAGGHERKGAPVSPGSRHD